MLTTSEVRHGAIAVLEDNFDFLARIKQALSDIISSRNVFRTDKLFKSLY